MSVVLERLSPQLIEYGGVCADGDFIRKTLSAIAALKAAGIDADALELAAHGSAGGSARLAAKLTDLAPFSAPTATRSPRGFRIPTTR